MRNYCAPATRVTTDAVQNGEFAGECGNGATSGGDRERRGSPLIARLSAESSLIGDLLVARSEIEQDLNSLSLPLPIRLAPPPRPAARSSAAPASTADFAVLLPYYSPPPFSHPSHKSSFTGLRRYRERRLPPRARNARTGVSLVRIRRRRMRLLVVPRLIPSIVDFLFAFMNIDESR